VEDPDESLPSAELEVKMVSQFLKKETVLFSEGQLRRSVHSRKIRVGCEKLFSIHATANPIDARRSYIRMANGGQLDTSQLAELNFTGTS